MGVFFSYYEGVVPGSAEDEGERRFDPVFNDGVSHTPASTTRRVPPRNTPSAINAVFNFTNFWDGRANPRFNGQNPFGDQDPDAVVWVKNGAGLREERLSLTHASLASQAVGPGNSHFEMAFGDGASNMRNWPEIGAKLLGGEKPLTPLGKQLVDSTDSVLGSLRAPSGRGLKTTYRDMIKAAFSDKYWSYSGQLEIIQKSPKQQVAAMPTEQLQSVPASTKKGNGRSYPRIDQMEANMAFFFGMAVMMYESTLVADQSPFDRWMETGVSTPEFGAEELAGLNIFVGDGHCVNCHGGPELTNASVRHAEAGRKVIEPMPMAQGTAFYDTGFYNIGVTPTIEDLGRGGNDLNDKPLAFSRQSLLSRVEGESFGFPIIGDKHIPAVDEFGNVTCDDQDGDGVCGRGEAITPAFRRVAVDGAFKVPGLRNQELLGPYMHNGSLATLRQVVQFYNRGGNFCATNLADLDPDIRPLNLDETAEKALVAFLVSLTDDRTKRQAAPFDHPELWVPTDGLDHERYSHIPEVGRRGGRKSLGRFLNLDPAAPGRTVDIECSKN